MEGTVNSLNMSDLAIALAIIVALGIGYTVGFVFGFLACRDRSGKTFLGRFVVVVVAVAVALLLLINAGCSPVVQESVTITDIEKKLPVPGDTVTVENAPSDTLVEETPDWDPEYRGEREGRLIPNWPAWRDYVLPDQLEPRKVRFTAKIDTTAHGIRFRGTYRYPEDLWTILIEQKMREVSYRDRDTTGSKVVRERVEVFPWWGYLILLVALAAVIWSIVQTLRSR